MKYLLTAFLAIAALAFAGCGAKTETLPSTQNAPKFESAAANDYVKAYSAYVNDMVTAYKAKDATKITELSTKGMEFANKASTALKELKGADVQKLQDWGTKVAQEMTDAISKAK